MLGLTISDSHIFPRAHKHSAHLAKSKSKVICNLPLYICDRIIHMRAFMHSSYYSTNWQDIYIILIHYLYSLHTDSHKQTLLYEGMLLSSHSRIVASMENRIILISNLEISECSNCYPEVMAEIFQIFCIWVQTSTSFHDD